MSSFSNSDSIKTGMESSIKIVAPIITAKLVEEMENEQKERQQAKKAEKGKSKDSSF
jgi:hypothetical protein